MSKEEKLRRAISNLLYIKEGIRIAPKDLRSTAANKVLTQEMLDTIERNESFIKEIENTVEFIDSISHPTGIYKFMKVYAEENGTQYTKKIDIKGRLVEVDDYYEANDQEEYVMIMIDHIGLISTEEFKGKQLNLHESISKLSSNYLIRLRNKYNYIPIVIQQQAAAQESTDNIRSKLVKPSLNGLADNKLTQRDADVILGLFSPFRFKMPQYPEKDGYDITYFRDNIRFLEILGGREGGGGTICPLFFDGKVNYFEELPLPHKNLSTVYEKVRQIRIEK